MSTPAVGDEDEMTATDAEVISGEVVENATDLSAGEAPPDLGPDLTAPTGDEPSAIEGDIIQPGDVEKPVGTVELRTPHGFLTLRPGQSQLDENQHAALMAIGIDLVKDPGVLPHLRAFIHMCQLRQLDPYAKEAYLIGRGKGEYRKWTMQTSIDGYRKMSASTGRYIRVKARLWTGPEDDPACWREVEEDGVLVRKRVWYDMWPSNRGYPGSAMVIVEHYDEQGRITTTAATADWKFYAPMNPVYEGSGNNRRKKLDANGQQLMELAEMWEKGDAHMLAKCAEALAHRLAFPNTVHGFYVSEEMHRLDLEERNRRIEEQRREGEERRAAARANADQRALTAQASNPPATIETAVTARAGEPVPAGQAVRETVEQMRAATRAPRGESRAPASALGTPATRADEATRLDWLRAEVAMLAQVFSMPKEKLLARQVAANGKPLDQFTADELLAAVQPMRASGAARLRAAGRGAEAAAYETIAPGAVMPLDILLGTRASEVAAEDVPVDPSAPHGYVDAGGICSSCGAFEDEPIHRG
jgi:hypothetical protein